MFVFHCGDLLGHFGAAGSPYIKCNLFTHLVALKTFFAIRKLSSSESVTFLVIILLKHISVVILVTEYQNESITHWCRFQWHAS